MSISEDLAEDKTKTKPIFLIIKVPIKNKRASDNENLILIFNSERDLVMILIKYFVQNCSIPEAFLRTGQTSIMVLFSKNSF